jgi:hypothetical protein
MAWTVCNWEALLVLPTTAAIKLAGHDNARVLTAAVAAAAAAFLFLCFAEHR